MIDNKIHKENYLRALITDTSPFDLPIIINNEGLYKNLIKGEDNPYLPIINKLIICNLDKTNPIEYSISKTQESVRNLSLPHPRIQYKMCEFYEEYSDLICYYTSLSPLSIRYPQKKSSTYYLGGNHFESRYKGDNIERDETDFRFKHNISFFKYKGFNRVYKFFSSGKYYTLEKKFPVFWSMDVSKCFESIYTHSLPWATKSKKIIKSDNNYSIDALFGQKLDTLMQKSNKNETNGIIIGPEFSRIFAEIIFQDIDLKVVNSLSNSGYELGKDYEACRYIDDIFIFAKSEDIAKIVFNRFSDELIKYNLHVNESKTKKLSRPFITSKSRTINKLNIELNSLSDSLFEVKEYRVEISNVFSHYNLSNRFIDKLKTICADTSSSYDDISSYTISALDQRVRKLIFSFENEESDEKSRPRYINIDLEEQENLYKVFLVFINIMFHMYSVSCSVTSSYVVSRCCLLISSFLKDISSDYKASIDEFIYHNIIEFINTYVSNERDKHLPLEVINLILVSSEFGYEYQLSEDYLTNLFLKEDSDITYFNAVTLLYYIKKYPKYRILHNKLISKIRNQIQNVDSFSENSSEIHLVLDTISCPYIEERDRIKLLRKLNERASLGIKVSDFPNVVKYAVENPWFVHWDKVNLFNLLEKKLLKRVYD